MQFVAAAAAVLEWHADACAAFVVFFCLCHIHYQFVSAATAVLAAAGDVESAVNAESTRRRALKHQAEQLLATIRQQAKALEVSTITGYAIYSLPLPFMS